MYGGDVQDAAVSSGSADECGCSWWLDGVIACVDDLSSTSPD